MHAHLVRTFAVGSSDTNHENASCGDRQGRARARRVCLSAPSAASHARPRNEVVDLDSRSVLGAPVGSLGPRGWIQTARFGALKR